MQLPFADGTFDAVVCQFGAMFFPDRPKAYSEARRVLRPGGAFIFNVWDRIEENEFADAITSALKSVFPEDPPLFLPRTPYGYHETANIRKDLAAAGFTHAAEIATIPVRSRAKSAQDPSIAFCQGTPLRGEIEARDASGLGKATDAATEAIARRFGPRDVDAKIQAHVITVQS
jgi:SAM-dependent methyltransferase